MSFFLNLLKPDPHLAEIDDPKKVDSLYKHWRIRILYSMFFGYALYYFTRKSFSLAKPGLIEEGFDKTQLGMVETVLAISYGMSKFASGILSDRSNPRYFMAFGLILTGLINIAFGFTSSLNMFLLLWAVNGWFQGFGAPPCMKFLTHWYSQSERGSWWSTWNMSLNVGNAAIPWIVGCCLQYFGWRAGMYVPGIICIIGGFVLINRLRDTPQSLGLPSIEKYRNDYPQGQSREAHENEKKLSSRELLVNYVLKNKFIWILAAAYFCVYAVRAGIDSWSPLFLKETKGYSALSANGFISIFECGGLCGGLAAGWASDKLFKAKRGPINIFFSIGILLSLIAFWSIPEGYQLLDSIALFCLGFSIFGPQMMIGIAAAELSHKKAAATATGFVGCFAYLGAAVSGGPLGKIAQEIGWDGFFIFLIGSASLAILVLLPTWNMTKSTQPLKQEPEYA